MRRGYPISVAIAALFFLGVVLPLPANADLQGIVDDYCSELITDSQEMYFYMQETGFQKNMHFCKNKYLDCIYETRTKTVECINEYRLCINTEWRKYRKVCATYLNSFRSSTRRAQGSARSEGVKDEFLDWLYGDTSVVSEPSSGECLGDDGHLDGAWYCAEVEGW